MAHRAVNCRATSICITEYIILFDNPIAAIFRNDPSCFAGSRMSLVSCEPHSSETSNQLQDKLAHRACPPGHQSRMLSDGGNWLAASAVGGWAHTKRLAAVLDNLGKSASGAAVQNLNLMLTPQ
jgi:hypothetical protein